MEPKYNRKSPDTFNQLIKGNKETLNTLYPSHKVSKLNASMISFRNVNQFPAKNGLLFQRLTFILSHTSWIPFFIIFLILRNKENELTHQHN